MKKRIKISDIEDFEKSKVVCLSLLKIYNKYSINRPIRFINPKAKKYQNIFVKIYNYLEEIKSDYQITIDRLLTDYFESIFDRYKFFNKVPYFSQLSPTDKNQLAFEEWIQKWEDFYGEDYFFKRKEFSKLERETIRARVFRQFTFNPELGSNYIPNIVEI